MRVVSRFPVAATVIALSLSGCASNLLSSSTSGSSALPNVAIALGRAGPPKVPAKGVRPQSSAPGFLYVANETGNIVVLKNGTYQQVGEIQTSANSVLFGLSVDSAGNLYSTNIGGSSSQNVEEYASGSRRGKCEYTEDLSTAESVAADSQGRVDVGNSNVGAGGVGWVSEFDQCKSKLIRQRFVPGGVEGVSIDRADDVFVLYQRTNETGGFAEFKQGTTKAVMLGATIGGTPGEVVVDKQANLIAADFKDGTIDVIAPPYGTAKPLITGLGGPYFIALSPDDATLFVTGFTGTISIYSYPSGKMITSVDLGASFVATGVADSK